ncbi:MAG: ATP-binding protein [Anaerolineae bacterium]|nr:ATP-binding protein [Anaerolineae bacterium]
MTLNFFDFRIRQRDYLLSIAQAMVSNLNVRAVLRKILEASVEMLQGYAGLIALRSEEGAFTFVASYGLPPAMVESFKILVNDLPESDLPADFDIPDLGEKLDRIAKIIDLPLQQVVALPMVAEQELLGLIFIFRTLSTRFSLDERGILASFADYAAIAVKNARLYEEAVNERRRLDALLESSADGIMVLRPNLTIERINRALSTLTGWPTAEVINLQHDDVIVWARRTSELTLSQAVEQGWPTRERRPLYIEGDLRRKNSSLISLAITYAPLVNRAGKLLNIVGTVRDITRFREADALKDTFISVVSHELKTPVAIIKGYAETLYRPEARKDADIAEEMLAGIIQESDRLARLVDDLLDASRLQAGGLPFHDVEDVDLPFIVRRVVDRYISQTEQHTLRVDMARDFPLIKGDPQRLEQVVDNLVSNAIKYSPRGGVIEVVGKATTAEVILTVSDQGVGIPLEEQGRIFDRFYRVEGPDTRAVPGTGLGLYIARAIVEAHGGRCWVNSAPGKGATFFVALPRETGLALWRGKSTIM